MSVDHPFYDPSRRSNREDMVDDVFAAVCYTAYRTPEEERLYGEQYQRFMTILIRQGYYQ